MIHKTAIIDPKAKIASNVEIGPYCLIGPDVEIGENTKMIICGDTMQSDISGRSGFKYIKDIFNDEDSAKQGIHNFEFDYKDIKRSEILKYIIKKLENSN